MKPPVTPVALDYLAQSLEEIGFEVEVLDLAFPSMRNWISSLVEENGSINDRGRGRGAGRGGGRGGAHAGGRGRAGGAAGRRGGGSRGGRRRRGAAGRGAGRAL